MGNPDIDIILRLSQLIKKRKIKNVDIAVKLNVTPGYISKMLSSDKMNTKLLEEIMEAAGITYSDLIHPEINEDIIQEAFEDIKENLTKSLTKALNKSISEIEKKVLNQPK